MVFAFEFLNSCSGCSVWSCDYPYLSEWQLQWFVVERGISHGKSVRKDVRILIIDDNCPGSFRAFKRRTIVIASLMEKESDKSKWGSWNGHMFA